MNINSEPVQKYYQRVEEILKLLKPIILNAIVDSEIISDEVLGKAFEELGLFVEELREQFESCQPLSGKVYFVLQVEALISRIQNSSLDIFQSLMSSDQHLLDELSSTSLEVFTKMRNHILEWHLTYKALRREKINTCPFDSISEEAVRDQVDSVGLSSEILMKIFESLSLNSNQEILNAEQAEKTAEVVFIDQLIALVSHMHHRLVLIKQSHTCSPIPIPADFCCPLSLELMTDLNWIDLGLTVCPKTRQTLAHINLIPNYTVKALITNWCESNNVKLPDPMKSINLNQSHSLLVHESKSAESGLQKDSNSFLHSRNGQSMSLQSWSPSQSGKNLITFSGLHREATSQIHPRSTSEGSLPVGQPPMSPSCKEFHNTEHSSQNHTRSDSTSSSLSNLSFPGGAVGDNIETSESQTMWRRPTERLLPRIVSSPATQNRAELSGIETQVKKLVEDLKSTSVDTQREAASQLRLLAKHNMDNRIIIANCGAISLLVDLLHSSDAKTQENADNKVRTGRSGAIRPLVDLLGNGTPRGKKDAATALFNLSIFHENKAQIVEDDAVRYLVDLMDPAAGMVDKAVAVLANLATIPEGRTTIGQEGGIPVLVEVVELASARGKKYTAAALLQLCTNSSRFCIMVLQGGAVPPLVALSQSGTPRAKEKALLSYFRSQRHGNAGRG
ncbi:hypothetical protein ERO13_D03G026450v2 [Gossypium hirsutum]|nr:hypothetical protein ERO13_D03G026450v2 [Gossypium hirsutum]